VDKEGKAAVARLLQQKAAAGAAGGSGSGTAQWAEEASAACAGNTSAGDGSVQQQGSTSRPLLCVGDSCVDLPMLSVPGVEPLVVPRRADLLQAVAQLQAAAAGGQQEGERQEGPMLGFKQLVYPGMSGRVQQGCSLPELSMEQLAVSDMGQAVTHQQHAAAASDMS
jgi:hypothetical protein